MHGHGRQGGDNKQGYCHNLTLIAPTAKYPLVPAPTASRSRTPQRTWSSSRQAATRSTAGSSRAARSSPYAATGAVKLKQDGNASCYHRLYHWPSCFVNGDRSAGPWTRGRYPVSIENVVANWSHPGQFYYDRAGGSIGYIPRAGETAASIEAAATTATVEEILVVNGSQHVRFENVKFNFATWSGSSGYASHWRDCHFADALSPSLLKNIPKVEGGATERQSCRRLGNAGYVDIQSGYLCAQGEPPMNVEVFASTDVVFSGCEFRHLGAVYALGAHNASQDVVVSNCTFTDCSGGAIKLGNVGERGAPGPAVDLPVALQDRGYQISDNHIFDLPREYSSANPIFAGYVADTTIEHNDIKKSTYSAICAARAGAGARARTCAR